MRFHSFWNYPALLLLLSACTSASGSERRTGPPSTPAAAPAGRIIDSLLPLEEEIRRFRLGMPETPARLTGGAPSRDRLVRRWVTAIEQRDSLALAEMLITPAEYITFYYPESPYTRPPYRQKPSLRWFLMLSSSSQGLARVWSRHAGSPLGQAGYECRRAPEMMGRNRIWNGCVVILENGGEKVERRLFGSILERDGQFKFLSYATDY